MIFLAGQKYLENLIDTLQAASNRAEISVKGLGIGQQLQWLTQQNSKEPDVNVTNLLSWGPWYDLNGASRNPAIPRKTAGLYRIRRVGFDGLEYIGQTGASNGLRSRMGNLLGVFKEEMPYRDPHTAGPALWALRQAGSDLEVSVCTVEGSTPWRKGLEALAISLHRQEQGGSPTVNFGRMPTGYRMSSANNNRLAEAGNKYRGGLSLEDDESHLAGIPPVGLLGGSPESLDWCGHVWSPWTPASDLGTVQDQATGLYRIRTAGADVLLYIGEGKIRDRLQAHFKKMDKDDHAQGQIFREAGELEFSWVAGEDWLKHHLLELENDLIAAHLLGAGQIPAAQFLG